MLQKLGECRSASSAAMLVRIHLLVVLQVPHQCLPDHPLQSLDDVGGEKDGPEVGGF